MGATIRAATAADFFGVYNLLRGSTLNSRDLPLENRRRMFNPPWPGTRDTHGYVMEDNNVVVGFLGTLFTEHFINGAKHRFCEIHSWYVAESHRNQSLLLLMPVLSMRDVTLLNYTPTNSVYEVGKKFGFNDLETHLALFYPLPAMGPRLTVIDDRAKIPEYLMEEGWRLYADHMDVNCLHVVIEETDQGSSPPLYLILKSMRRKWFEPFGRLLYASDYGQFLKVVRRLTWRLCLRYRWQCLAANADVFDGMALPRFSRVKPRPVPSQFKSRELKADDIVPLYSLPLLIGYRLH